MATTSGTHAVPFLLSASLFIGSCGGGGGDGSSGAVDSPPPAAFTDSVVYSLDANASLPSAAELVAVTKHQISLGGETLNYTATAGHMTALSVPGGTPEASFFYVAYTLDGAAPSARPVTFFYNGGPGVATAWLHLGSFGPKRLDTHSPLITTPTPFALVDNGESLLDVSDLVFVDAIGTGFSEAVAPSTNRTWWSVDSDARVFRDFVMRYVAVNHRAASPKFIFGESYGTTRSAVLANLLESAGMSLAGVVFQSSILNHNSNCAVAFRSSCSPLLPSYAATGAWLNLTSPPQPPARIPAYMVTMRDVARTQYEPAVGAYLATGRTPPAALIGQLVAQTGLAADAWTARFNVDTPYFTANIVPGSLAGRYDGRMVAPRGTPLGDSGDPSTAMYEPSFASQIVAYLAQDLRYTTPSAYVLTAGLSWDYSHGGLAQPDTIPDLGAALAQNPALKVFSANGHYDLATPFLGTENDLSRLGYPANPAIAAGFYQGGHMTYLDDVGRAAEKADLAAFYRAAAPKREVDVGEMPLPAAAETRAPGGGSMPPAIVERHLYEPLLDAARMRSEPVPPTRGAELAAQVEQRLRDLFDAAPGARRGFLTRAEARAAGLNYIADRFDAIDANHRGAVTFDDVMRYLRERSERR